MPVIENPNSIEVYLDMDLHSAKPLTTFRRLNHSMRSSCLCLCLENQRSVLHTHRFSAIIIRRHPSAIIDQCWRKAKLRVPVSQKSGSHKKKRRWITSALPDTAANAEWPRAHTCTNQPTEMSFVCECIFTLAFTSIFGHNGGECGTLAATATVRRRGTVKMVEICVQMDERVGDQAEKEHSTTQRLKQTLADRQLKGMGKCMLTSNVWKYLFYMNFHFLCFFVHSLLQQYFSLYADNDRCFDLPQQHNTAIFWYLVCAWVALYWSWSPLKLCSADWLNPPTAFTATAFKLLSKYFIQHNLILKFVAKHYTSFFSAFAIKDSVWSAKHILNFFLIKM